MANNLGGSTERHLRDGREAFEGRSGQWRGRCGPGATFILRTFPNQCQLLQVIKHKNNKQTSRKQKEETPPAPVVEEDTKEEKAKLVPTSEQLRLAQITQSQDNTMDPQRKAKISQVMDITGKSEDEVATALFDCGWDAARAIDMLLEEGQFALTSLNFVCLLFLLDYFKSTW